jgi:hypothetical protein
VLTGKPLQLTPDQLAAVRAAPDVDVGTVHAMLQRLAGRRLNYHAYARDTPPGKDCECTLLTARALRVLLPPSAAPGSAPQPCMAVELVGDRFLRRMARVLVGTAVREALVVAQKLQQQQQDRQQQHAAPATYEALVALTADGGERVRTAAPAPSLGLCFAGVGFE